MNQFYKFKIGLNLQFIRFPEPWATHRRHRVVSLSKTGTLSPNTNKQGNCAAFNQFDVDSTCKLCSSLPESHQHFRDFPGLILGPIMGQKMCKISQFSGKKSQNNKLILVHLLWIRRSYPQTIFFSEKYPQINTKYAYYPLFCFVSIFPV